MILPNIHSGMNTASNKLFGNYNAYCFLCTKIHFACQCAGAVGVSFELLMRNHVLLISSYADDGAATTAALMPDLKAGADGCQHGAVDTQAAAASLLRSWGWRTATVRDGQ